VHVAQSEWKAPPATDGDFRTAGYTREARNYPLSEAGARWVAAFNGVPFDKLPSAWCYAPNPFMLAMIEEKANGHA
jgi:hypothetical protein